MSQSKSSRRWLDRHFKDEYVKRARQAGYRSRAAFKLLELQERDRILKHGMRVIDLGAAPGGWSQIAAGLVGAGGQVIALDLLPMDPLPRVTVLQGDFREDETLAGLLKLLGGEPADLILSDMAPNVSGQMAVDQPRMMFLCELALGLARQVLKPGGGLAVKIFQGAGFESFQMELRASFARVVSRKPKSSRANSRELYLVANGFHP